MSELIEKTQGQGRVFSGERFVAAGRYVVSVFQHYDEMQFIQGGELRAPVIQSIELSFSEPAQGARRAIPLMTIIEMSEVAF